MGNFLSANVDARPARAEVNDLSISVATSSPDDDAEDAEYYAGLVLSALPVVRRASCSLSRKYGPRDKRTDYLKDVESSAVLLEDYLGRIKGSADGFSKIEDKIIKLACCLEGIFDALRIASDPDDIESLFPRLVAVHKAAKIQDCGHELDPQPDSDASHINNPNSWKTLRRKLAALTDELQPSDLGNSSNDKEESSLPKTWLPPDDGVCHFFDRAFGAVICKCDEMKHMTRTQTLRLRVGTYRSNLRKPDPKFLCFLIPLQARVGEWYELCLHNSKPESIAHSEQGTRVAADNCKRLNKHTEPSFRLDLNLRQGCLDYSNRSPADRTFQTESLQGQIDLKSLLSLKERRWDTGTRCALAVLLAYTLLYLYGGSHFQGLWQRENISFFHDGDRIPLRPFFGATLADDAFWRRGNAASPDSQHRHPDILMLGVMLLEIYLGKRLESFLEMDGDITDVNDLYLKAWVAYKRLKFENIPGRYREVILACIDPQYFPVAHADDDKSMRSEIFQRIVRPLDEDVFALLETWQVLQLDDALADKYDLAHGLSVPLSTLEFDKKASCSSQQLDSPGTQHSTCTPHSTRAAISLFDDGLDIVAKTDDRTRHAEGFFQKFEEFYQRVRKPLRNGLRAKIAVLDTGVDLEQLVQLGEIKRTRNPIIDMRSFIEPEAEHGLKDTCGHGTHVMEILLRLAPEADFYIAKIAHGLDVDEVDHIAKAIDWARDSGCDIINMSFGINTSAIPEVSLRRVKDAVDHAAAAGKIMFAAASNCGGNGGRAYPARDPNVICIHASDGKGNDGGINPPAEEHPDYFSTLGVAIRCCWDEEFVYKSGTSFATPVAAAIAANFLDYATYLASHGSLTELQNNELRRSQGMKKVFTKFLSKRIQSHRYVAPWHFWAEEADDNYLQMRMRVEFTI